MSRYTGLYTFIYNGKKCFVQPKYFTPPFFRQFNSILVKVSEKDTLDGLAFDYYDGRGELWWIIAMANGFYLPTDMAPNQILTIPTDYNGVLEAMAAINQG